MTGDPNYHPHPTSPPPQYPSQAYATPNSTYHQQQTGQYAQPYQQDPYAQYPPQQQYYPPQQSPQQHYPQQQQYPQQGGYFPQGHQPMVYQAPPGQMTRKSSGFGGGEFCAGLCAALLCCCALDVIF